MWRCAVRRHTLSLLLVATLLVPGRSVLGQAVAAEQRADSAAPPTTRGGEVTDDRLSGDAATPRFGWSDGVALKIVTGASLVGLALLGLMAYARRRQDTEGEAGRGGPALAPAGTRATARLDTDIIDANGRVVLPRGSIVELSVLDRTTVTASERSGPIQLDVTGVRASRPQTADAADYEIVFPRAQQSGISPEAGQ